MIYIAQAGLHYKIGYSAADPKKRIQNWSVGTPGEVRLLCVLPGGVRDERHLHRHFAQRRVQREWFALSCEDLQSLRGAIPWVEPAGERPQPDFANEDAFRGHVEDRFFDSVAMEAIRVARMLSPSAGRRELADDDYKAAISEAEVNVLRGGMDAFERPYFDYPLMYRKWLAHHHRIVAQWEAKVARWTAAQRYLRGELALMDASAILEKYAHTCSLCGPHETGHTRPF